MKQEMHPVRWSKGAKLNKDLHSGKEGTVRRIGSEAPLAQQFNLPEFFVYKLCRVREINTEETLSKW